MPIRKLTPEQLRRSCSKACIPWTNTKAIPIPKKIEASLGHQRAIKAINFGLSNPMKGFNIFLLGEPGSGKTSILRKLLQRQAKATDTPPDQIYVHNFDNPNLPLAYLVPPGVGRQVEKDLNELITELKRIITMLQEGERYLQLGQAIEERYRRREDRAFSKLRKIGQENDLSIEKISGELMIQVIRNGQPLDHEEFEQLTARQREYYEKKVRDIQDDISDFMRIQRKMDREKQEKILKLEHDQILKNTEDVVGELIRKYKGIEDFNKWLNKLWLNIPDAFREYQRAQDEMEQAQEMPVMFHPPAFQQFRVKLLVDNSQLKGAPVIFDTTGSYHNLVGCVEYQEHYGMPYTDFTLIRPGSLHQANGGYLVIQVNDLMKSMYAWDALKKALRNREIRIAEVDIEQRGRSTVSPKPEPIPLNVKVILIGNYDAYYYLLNYDEDFSRLFKVKAEFDDVVPFNTTNVKKYAGFIARLVHEDKLLPFDRSAIARIVEQGSRLAEHQKKLSARYIQIINYVSEAHFWALEEGARIVKAEHVQRAIRERSFRTGKIEYEMYDQIKEGTVLIDTRGRVVGQINGIALYDMGDHAFGIPSRITARTYVGRSGILNIDREANLSGQIHNKASLILVGLIGHLYAQKKPLSMSASVCFEQMYGSIDGDSASCAELFALISSLSKIPINQGICITGSLNQKGEVQPIGGVNEKIEGVFKICKAKGLDGKQGVVIPVQNVINLMLDEEIIDAVAKGRFHIWAIKTINEGIEAVMGMKASKVHSLVRKRLTEIQTALDGGDD